MALLPTYNERSDFELGVTLTDTDGDPLTPDTAHYSVYDTASEALLVDWTEFTVTAGDGTIEVPTEATAIVTSSNNYETRVLTVALTYAGGKEHHEEYWFRVKNLQAIPRAT